MLIFLCPAPNVLSNYSILIGIFTRRGFFISLFGLIFVNEEKQVRLDNDASELAILTELGRLLRILKCWRGGGSVLLLSEHFHTF